MTAEMLNGMWACNVAECQTDSVYLDFSCTKCIPHTTYATVVFHIHFMLGLPLVRQDLWQRSF